MRHFAASLVLLLAASCDADPEPPDPDGGPAEDGGGLLNGCPSLRERQATAGDDIGGDTWETFAGPFFSTWCTRCHSSARSGDDRFGAPDGFDWDDEASVRANLSAIRSAVGVTNFMPPNEPRPPCDERARMVRWLDAGAP